MSTRPQEPACTVQAKQRRNVQAERNPRLFEPHRPNRAPVTPRRPVRRTWVPKGGAPRATTIKPSPPTLPKQVHPLVMPTVPLWLEVARALTLGFQEEPPKVPLKYNRAPKQPLFPARREVTPSRCPAVECQSARTGRQKTQIQDCPQSPRPKSARSCPQYYCSPAESVLPARPASSLAQDCREDIISLRESAHTSLGFYRAEPASSQASSNIVARPFTPSVLSVGSSLPCTPVHLCEVSSAYIGRPDSTSSYCAKRQPGARSTTPSFASSARRNPTPHVAGACPHPPSDCKGSNAPVDSSRSPTPSAF